MIKNLWAIAAVASLAIGTLPAHAAEKFPSRQGRLIVPYTPGGNTDLLARVIAQKLTEAWGQTVVAENRPGAAGTIGVDMVAKSRPDGYTTALASFGNILVAGSLYPKLPYDPIKDLTPVILVATPPTILVANPSVPANDVKSLIAYAKANPGKLNYGSSGNGTSNHLFGALFESMAGVRMIHVPYKGSGPAVSDVVGGTIQLSFAPFPLVLEQIKAGRLKALAVTGSTRSPVLPEVPTIAESGVPGYEGIGWFGLMAPAGTPKEVVNQLNKEVNRILNLPEVKANLASEGAVPVGGTPEEAARSIVNGVKKWGGLVKELDIRL